MKVIDTHEVSVDIFGDGRMSGRRAGQVLQKLISTEATQLITAWWLSMYYDCHSQELTSKSLFIGRN